MKGNRTNTNQHTEKTKRTFTYFLLPHINKKKKKELNYDCCFKTL